MLDNRRKQPWESAAEAFSRKHVSVCCCGGAGFVRTNAPLGHLLFGKAIPCVCQRDDFARERGARLRRRSGIGEAEWNQWTFETFRPELCKPEATRETMGRIRALCQEYARRPEGWLILRGSTGSGKTHLAYAVAREALADGRPVFAHTVPDVLGLLRSTLDLGQFDAVFSDLCQVGLLVLDDLGAERETDWATEQLYRLVNYRYAKRLPMVVTTNVDLGVVDGRIASRLTEGLETRQGWARLVTLPCGDFRPWRGR